jgi:NDP-sugar pyrophosphorylase family protein
MAMVLAAGRGTRLGPLTEARPKPMMPLGGRPILQNTLELLGRAGIRDVIINLHHHGDQIRSHFGDGGGCGVRITYSEEPILQGTAGALRPFRDVLTSTFLVVYGDNFFRCDLERLVEGHCRRRGLGTMALWEWPDATQSGIARLDGESRIVEFLEKPPPDTMFSPLINAGLLVWEPEVFRYIANQGPVDFSRDVVPRVLAAGERVHGHVLRDPELLLWVDTPEDFQRAEARAAGQVAS